MSTIQEAIRDAPDDRDYPYQWDPGVPLPRGVDLRQYCTPVENQGAFSSCTAQAVCGALEMRDPTDWSRLFNYRLSRLILGDTFASIDGGSSLRAALKAARMGTPPENLWPYSMPPSADPPPIVVAEAAKHQAGEYRRIDGIWKSHPVAYAIASGLPVLVSMRIGERFQGLGRGEACPPVGGGNPALPGLHAVLLVGYRPGEILVRNSWGTGWADGGYGWISASAVDQDAMDIWVLDSFKGIGSVGPNRVHRWFRDWAFANQPSVRQFVADQLAAGKPGAILDKLRLSGLPVPDLEAVMGWPAGLVGQYRQDHPDLDWSGVQ